MITSKKHLSIMPCRMWIAVKLLGIKSLKKIGSSKISFVKKKKKTRNKIIHKLSIAFSVVCEIAGFYPNLYRLTLLERYN